MHDGWCELVDFDGINHTTTLFLERIMLGAWASCRLGVGMGSGIHSSYSFIDWMILVGAMAWCSATVMRLGFGSGLIFCCLKSCVVLCCVVLCHVCVGTWMILFSDEYEWWWWWWCIWHDFRGIVVIKAWPPTTHHPPAPPLGRAHSVCKFFQHPSEVNSVTICSETDQPMWLWKQKNFPGKWEGKWRYNDRCCLMGTSLPFHTPLPNNEGWE